MPVTNSHRILATLVLTTGLFAHGALAENFKLAHQFAPDSLPGLSAQRFADLVSEKTKGESKVTVLPGGALGDERANLQQVETGSIDFALTGDLVVSFMAQPYMLVSMPFIFDSPQHSLAVFNGEIGSDLNGYLNDNRSMQVLGWQYVGTRVLTSNRPVKSLADLKGLKTRMPAAQMWINAWQKAGIDVASVAFTELYLALQTGTVDAQENPPNFIRAQKFYEVQKYLMPTNHVPQMQAFFASASKMTELDDTTRKAVQEAAAETVSWTSQLAEKSQETDIEWLVKEGGMTVVDVDTTGIQDLIKDVPREVLGDDGVKLYERIVAARP
ncbi:TRAP transporter substrate-binding protein [Brucella sp. C7-11G]